MKNKINATSLNIIANLFSMVATFVISFFLTPFLTKHVGMEAYGLVGLANNFTSYLTIATAALNSMASRFIIIELHKKNTDEANAYFNSVLIANSIFAVLTVIGGVILSLNISHVINVSSGLVYDASITFLLVFINFAVSLAFSTFSVVYYYKNKLYIGAFNTILSEAVRIVIILLLFKFLGIKIQYTVLALIVSMLYANIFAFFYSRKNIPELKLSPKLFNIKKILRIITSGIWNSISKLSQILLNGLDLLIINLFINGTVMGIVSLGKHFSTIIISIISSVSDAFLPKFLKAYANSEEELHKEFFKSTKTLGYFSCIIISLFLIFCRDFFSLWVPEQDPVFLSHIAFLSLLPLLISGPVYSMFSIYTVADKVKVQALATLIMSVLSTATVFVLLKFTSLGVYAIVGPSAIYGTIKNLTYNMYCLKKYVSLNIKKCYLIILKNLFTMTTLIFINSIIKTNFLIDNFFKLAIAGILSFILCNIIYFIIALNIKDKKMVLSFIKKQIFLKKRES